ncbi:GIY-YIG nuclease family protein [Sporosarcina sp. CAU 1771]
MSFWNKAFNVGKVVFAALAEEGQKAQGRAYQQAGKTLAEREKQINKYEGMQHKMTTEQREKFEQIKQTHEQRKKSFQDKGVTVTSSGEMRFGDFSYREWDRKWESIGQLASANLTPYNRSVGLYRHTFRGEIVYIGRAIELNNGGFRKRLSDYRRDSDSARTHKSGRLINENLDQIRTDILVVGTTEKDIHITKELERVFVGKYTPKWNTMLK